MRGVDRTRRSRPAAGRVELLLKLPVDVLHVLIALQPSARLRDLPVEDPEQPCPNPGLALEPGCRRDERPEGGLRHILGERPIQPSASRSAEDLR